MEILKHQFSRMHQAFTYNKSSSTKHLANREKCFESSKKNNGNFMAENDRTSKLESALLLQ